MTAGLFLSHQPRDLCLFQAPIRLCPSAGYIKLRIAQLSGFNVFGLFLLDFVQSRARTTATQDLLILMSRLLPAFQQRPHGGRLQP